MARQLRDLARRIAALSDIHEIVGAMRGLAFVELRRLQEAIAHQREVLAARERAIADLLAHFPQPLPESAGAGDVWLAIGSERGFCGDLNAALAAALSQSADARGCRLLAVGSRLAPALAEEGIAHEALVGATVADEVPRVLHRIALALGAEAPVTSRVFGLVVLHPDSDGTLRRERLLPSPAPPRQAEPETVLQIQLPARALFQALMDQDLLDRLNAALLGSLHAENRRRLDHTGAALDRLERTLDVVQRQRRRARQAAITEEIEVMLLGGGGIGAVQGTPG